MWQHLYTNQTLAKARRKPKSGDRKSRNWKRAMCENSLHAYHTTQQHTPSTIGMRPIATPQDRSSMPRSLDLTVEAICVIWDEDEAIVTRIFTITTLKIKLLWTHTMSSTLHWVRICYHTSFWQHTINLVYLYMRSRLSSSQYRCTSRL